MSLPRHIEVLASLFVFATTTVFADIPKPDDAPRPLSPEESAKHFRLPKGFKIDLVASEPLIADPSCVAWDEFGRLFVCELHGYNMEGQLDVDELNKTGKLDTAIRRFRVGAEVKKQAQASQRGSLKLLRDTDGDGRMDKSIVWADDIPPAYGIVPARGGIIVTCAPHILFFADRDGDDKPEVRETLFTGFEIGELERGINNPIWGIDNWIYVAKSYGGEITGPNLKGSLKLGRTDFRIKPDGSKIEPVSGENHTFGMSFDDHGNRWLITGGNHARYAAPLPYRYLARNPHVASPGTTINAANYNNVFPSSQPHPWRRKRGADPRWVKFYGAHEAKPNGNFTSACGTTLYRADLFPEKYHGNHFACDPQQSIVHRSIIERDGSGLKVRRPAEHADNEFLSSTDGWFRPNNLRVGPDGALYIIDMYREIIEDYSAIPRYLQQQYGLTNGTDRGRIWRLAPKATAFPVKMVPPAKSNGQELVAMLKEPNAWWRTTAQRLLIERKSEAQIDMLRAARWTNENGFVEYQQRLHALYALDGLDALRPRDLISGLNDPHYSVRTHTLRLGERWLDSNPAFQSHLLQRVQQEKDPNVLLQLALSLGESKDPEAVDSLGSLAENHINIRWMDAAILSSLRGNADTFLVSILARNAKMPASMLSSAARMLARSGEAKRITRVLARIEREIKSQGSIANVISILEGFGEIDPSVADEAMGAQLANLIGHGDERVRLQAFTLATRLGLGRGPEFAGAVDDAVALVVGRLHPPAKRLTAVELIPYASEARVKESVKAILNPIELPAFQEDAVRRLLSRPNDLVTDSIIAHYSLATPRLASTIIESLLSQESSSKKLIKAVAKGTIKRSALSALQRHRLLSNGGEEAEKLFSTAPPAVGAESAAWKSLVPVVNKGGDPALGAALFTQHCATCHQFGGKGVAVGPGLDGESGRPAESLLADIVSPNTEITAGYNSYVIKTKSGSSHGGVLAGESATSLTLKQTGGAAETVLRADVESIEKLEISLMPPTFTELLKPQEIADLIAYLKSKPSGNSLVLFDDDPGFPGALKDGRGSAILDWTDASSGRACITIQPFQRHQRHLPGWKFLIREEPAKDEGEKKKKKEFRYLRIAMKTRGAHGIMLELAADGSFPPESQPIRTYYAGRNSTGWKSNELDKTAPADWKTYTIDLWKGNGDFTLTGIALTVMGGPASYDRIELLREKPGP